MAQALFDRMLGKLVQHGVLEVVHADGQVAKFGLPAPGFPALHVGT